MSISNALLRHPIMTGESVPDIIPQEDLTKLQTEMVSNAIQQQDLINASIAAGGPSSLNDAIMQAMDICNVSLDTLSKKVKVSKYRLNKMLSGSGDMTPKILGRIMRVFHQSRPDLYPAD